MNCKFAHWFERAIGDLIDNIPCCSENWNRKSRKL